MEGDRAAVLTLRSAVKGVIDYSEADLNSPMWWRRWRYLLQAMTEVEHGELLQTAYDFQLALISNSKISPENFTKLQGEAKDTFVDIESTYKPWLGRNKEDRKVRDSEKFKQEWEAIAGFSVDDEEAMAAWEEKVNELTGQTLRDHNAEEEKERKQAASFAEVAKRVQEKRLRQQGRIK